MSNVLREWVETRTTENYELTLTLKQYDSLGISVSESDKSYLHMNVNITKGPSGVVPVIIKECFVYDVTNNNEIVYQVPASYQDFQVVQLTSSYYNNYIIYNSGLDIPIRHRIDGTAHHMFVRIILSVNGEEQSWYTDFAGAKKGIDCAVYLPTSCYLGDTVAIEAHKGNPDHMLKLTYDFGNLTGTIGEYTGYDLEMGVGDYVHNVDWTPLVGEFFPYFGVKETARIGKIYCEVWENIGTADEPQWSIVGRVDEEFTLYSDSSKYLPVIDHISVKDDINSPTYQYTYGNTVLGNISNALITIQCHAASEGWVSRIDVYCEDKRAGISIAENEPATPAVIIPQIPGDVISVTLVDNYGISATYQYKIDQYQFQKYFKPLCHVNVQRLTGVGELSFTVSGKYFQETIGDSGRNTITKYEYCILGPSTPYAEWQTLPRGAAVIDEQGNYTITTTISGLNYKTSYQVVARVTDKFYTVTSPTVSTVGFPVFDWSKSDFNFNVPVKMQDGVEVIADESVYGLKDGERYSALVPMSSTGDTILGQGNYLKNNGNTLIYGTNVDIMAHEDITVNGKSLLNNKLLWEGGLMMSSGHTANLSENISDQKNGIVLVFSLYRNGAAEDVSINSFFISKKEVELLPEAPHFFFLGINAGFSSLAGKYIYIHDDKLVGHEGNDDTGTSIITFNNSSYVLRYVIGV